METSSTTNVVRFRPRRRVDPSQYLLRWASLDETPRVLVLEDLSVLWTNAAARIALAERRDIAVRAGALAMTDRANAQALANFVRSASDQPSDWCLPRSDGDGHLLFRAVRLDGGDGGEDAIAIGFHGTGADFQPAWTGFKEAFGLTTAETDIVRALLDGETAAGIAARLAISVGTVRTHIRNAYAKLEVNSREHLFRRLTPFRADLA
ncbi:MAG TPA: LuxR C-terminal-related transcriptional regulator [Caulobacteraceae bacterium]|nr:LuxR C-terminal-related transcriptional regulator [Caulobacteraceae bacterium]